MKLLTYEQKLSLILKEFPNQSEINISEDN